MKSISVLILVLIILAGCDEDQQVKDDYFPIVVGNKWTFDYAYQPYGSWDIAGKKFGVYRVEIVSSNADNTIYHIKEIIEGNELVIKDYDKGTYDTLSFEPDTMYTEYKSENEWVEIKFSPFYIESGSVSVKRYFSSGIGNVVYLTNHTSNADQPDTQYIKGDWNFYEITLEKDVGPIYWKMCCSSNSAPSLIMTKVN